MRYELNIETGEQILRQPTVEEVAAEAKMIADDLAIRAERDAADAAKILAKASARAKLAALGLTEEEIKALVG